MGRKGFVFGGSALIITGGGRGARERIVGIGAARKTTPRGERKRNGEKTTRGCKGGRGLNITPFGPPRSFFKGNYGKTVVKGDQKPAPIVWGKHNI